MKKYSSWLSALFALVFIAVPSIVIIYFLMDMSPNYGIVFGSAFAVLIGGNLLAYIAYKLEVFGIDAFSFIVPITIVFFGLIATVYQHWWVMLIVALVGVLSSFPTNMLITKIKEHKRHKLLESAKKANKKSVN